ncbi:MAG: radical SAM protein [Lachnospiraceae bacterium]|nr:radical SAM protein [Lachnospiraceae bacterium]
MPKRNPTTGTFELTIRCNLHCKMCLFRRDDCKNAELKKNELTASQWMDMARQAADAGTFSILITGGEPMLRPDFCEIWKGIYRYGFVLTLYTNATLVTPEVMETLKKYPPHKIGVTIYGASPETYEKVCGNANAFQKAMDGIHELSALPSKMEYRMTVIQDNMADSKAVTELVQREFGEKAFLMQDITVMHAVRGGCADVDSCRLTPEMEAKRSYDHIMDVMRKVVGSSFDPQKVRLDPQLEKKRFETNCKKTVIYSIFGCNAGMSQYTVTYDGKLTGCQLLDLFYTDPIEMGFREAWNHFPYVVKLPPVSEKCRNCDVVAECQSCYATRYAETGSLNGCSDYLYRDAYIRSKFKEKLRRNKSYE